MNSYLINLETAENVAGYLSEFLLMQNQGHYLLYPSAFATLQKLSEMGYLKNASYRILPEGELENIEKFPVFTDFKEVQSNLENYGADISYPVADKVRDLKEKAEPKKSAANSNLKSRSFPSVSSKALKVGTIDISKFMYDANNIDEVISSKLDNKYDVPNRRNKNNSVLGLYSAVQKSLQTSLEGQLYEKSLKVGRLLSDPENKRWFEDVLKETAARVKREGLAEISELEAKQLELERGEETKERGIARVQQAYQNEMMAALKPEVDKLIATYRETHPDNTEEEVTRVRDEYERTLIAPLQSQIKSAENLLRVKIDDEVAKTMESGANQDQIQIIEYLKMKRQFQMQADGSAEVFYSLAEQDKKERELAAQRNQEVSSVPTDVIERLNRLQQAQEETNAENKRKQEQILSRFDNIPQPSPIIEQVPVDDGRVQALEEENAKLQQQLEEASDKASKFDETMEINAELLAELQRREAAQQLAVEAPVEAPVEEEAAAEDEELNVVPLQQPESEIVEEADDNLDDDTDIDDNTDLDDDTDFYETDEDKIVENNVDDEAAGDKKSKKEAKKEQKAREKEAKKAKAASANASGKKRNYAIPAVILAAIAGVVVGGSQLIGGGNNNANKAAQSSQVQKSSSSSDSNSKEPYKVGQEINVEATINGKKQTAKATVKYKQDGYWYAEDAQGNLYKLPNNPAK